MGSCRQFLQYFVSVNACIFTFSKISCFAESTAVCPAVYDHQVCSVDLCQNGGKCVQDDAGFRCQCNEGYKGLKCQKDINECASNPCLHGGKCFDGCNTYWCKCASGYSGHKCQNEFDVCSADLCKNGGTCLGDDEGVRCQCNVGFEGLRCEKDINECSPNPCFHGGKCVDGCNTYWCNCTSGFSGHRCQNEIDECTSNPCLNGGTCRDSIDAFSCQCKKGYKGNLCQDVDVCALKPCLHGSLCIADNSTSKYSCECKKGLTGINCEHNIDDCWWQPCQNRGTCIDGIDSYTCKCRGGFTGKYCETDIDECASNPCPRRAICIQGRGKHTCKCNRGYSGENCDIDECVSHPCQNGAICEQGRNTYNCFCKEGFTGTNCQKELKEDTEESEHSYFWLYFVTILALCAVLLWYMQGRHKKQEIVHQRNRRQIKTKVIEDMSECNICFTEITDAELVPCGHRICFECFLDIRQLGNSKTCPYCRGDMKTVIRLVSRPKDQKEEKVPERRQTILTKVIDDMSECNICYSDNTDAELVPCGHIVCFDCFLDIKQDGNTDACPYCRDEIKTFTLLVNS